MLVHRMAKKVKDSKVLAKIKMKDAIKEAKKFGLMDWNDSKTKDQNVYKSFEISMTSPGRFVAVSREGEKFEGNLSEVKKAVDDYWTRKEGKVSQSGWPKDSKTKDRKAVDGRDKLMERYKGVDVFFDHTDSLYWAIPKGGVGLNGRSISEIHSKIDQFREDQNAGDSKVKDDNQVVQIYRGVEILYDDAHGIYWCKYKGKTLTFEDNDLGRLKKKIDNYFEETEDSKANVSKSAFMKGTDAKDSLSYVTTYKGYEIAGSDKNIADKFLTTSKGYFLAASTLEELKRKIDQREKENSKDSSDVYTKDPLTKKGQKILEAMKKIYGEEKGEQIFYASRNKGTIENVDKNTSDSLSDMDKKQLALGKKFKIVLPSGMGESLYTNSFSEAVETSKEYGKGTPVVDLTKVTDSKTKDVELSVSELKNKALTKVLRDFYNGVKEVDSPATVAGAQKLTQMIQSETDPIKLKRWAGLDSKAKDDIVWEKSLSQLKLDLEEAKKNKDYVKIDDIEHKIKSITSGPGYRDAKGDSLKYIKSLTVEDQEIKIIIGEDPKVHNPAEQKVENNDVIYKEYTLKQLPETGEFEIYAPGGSIVGHAKALELAKLFVDRVVASKVSDAQSKDAMNESQVRSLCKQAGKEYLADNPDGDLDQVAGDIAEGIAYSNPQVLDFLKKEFGGSVTRRQVREYLADLI